MLCLKIAGRVANSVDPDETPRSAASHLGLHCLLRPACPNTYGIYPKYSDTLTLSIQFLKWTLPSLDLEKSILQIGAAIKNQSRMAKCQS